MQIIISDKIRDTVSYLSNLLDDNLLIVGGFVRDSLLEQSSKDLDLVSKKDTLLLKEKLSKVSYYKKYSLSSFSFDGMNITVARMRVESEYLDHRHPNKIVFVDDIYEDYKRRDFTIDSLYMDKEGNIIDPTSFGIDDVLNKKLRIIDDPKVRISEDPLRIARAYRFHIDKGFTYDEELLKVLTDNINLLKLIDQKKILEEMKKITNIDSEEAFKNLMDGKIL